MNNTDHLNRLGLFDAGVSRDTSDATAPVFTTYVDHMCKWRREVAISPSRFLFIFGFANACAGFVPAARKAARLHPSSHSNATDTGAIYAMAPQE